ncbi:hypothetical protein DFH27DRAFT_614318 [Peziza echinospora]|nr:hypothetical protein DFH27DRAFT_614318 [Peziza echinospora]
MKFLSITRSTLLGLAVLAGEMLGQVRANTPLDDTFVQNDLLYNNGREIAWASRPMWHFGESRDNKPCYPSAALTPDGLQHGVNPTLYPNAAEGCPDPGPRGGGANPFPTYFTVTSCDPNELRVAYHLYFVKDGWSDAVIAKGHMHDWERIIVTWKRNPATKFWTRTNLLKSAHSGYMEDSWGGIQNTFDEALTSEQNGKDKDHPKIYVGWGKHAMFSQRNTAFNDRISQGCGREFRSDDWWYMPKRVDMVPAGNGTVEGDRMKSKNWGSANSGPWVVELKVCGEKEGGYIKC